MRIDGGQMRTAQMADKKIANLTTVFNHWQKGSINDETHNIKIFISFGTTLVHQIEHKESGMRNYSDNLWAKE